MNIQTQEHSLIAELPESGRKNIGCEGFVSKNGNAVSIFEELLNIDIDNNRHRCYTVVYYFTKKSINFELLSLFRYHWVMKFCKKIFVEMLKFKDLCA